ncbi:MAG: glycosyl hydrolase [Bacteroidales bacterium]|nr:glycosyl hydrolase [Bacteroidales bacterium]
MSVREGKIMALAGGIDFANKSKEDLQDLFRKVLNKGMHGLCFSAYEEGQKPGDVLSENQIRRRMKIIQPYTKWVRSFSCIEGNELIPKIAKEFGLKTLVGAWLGEEPHKNELEVSALIQLAKEGYVDIAAVGNEVLYREELTENELLELISRVKGAIPNIPVGYVDAYYEFSERPKITEACDVILANCYPFWEFCHLDYSLMYMKQMFYQARRAGGGNKPVIITETGWPCKGEDHKGALPSMENAMKYFLNTQLWAKEEDIDIFYFTSFDESWKTGTEGDVGAYWGIWDKDENFKY